MNERKSNRAEALWGLILTGLLLFFALYNLRYFPPTWFDEGVHALVARHLALNGEYRSGPAVGPTVFLPVALAFQISGVGLIPARLVMVGYLLLCVTTFYLLARYLGGWKVAVVATVLFMTSPGCDLLRWGRQILGEVPALLFFLLALLAWCRAVDLERSPRRWGLVMLVGFLTGLAIVTKNQFLLLLPAWCALWFADRSLYRRSTTFDVVLVVGCALLCVTSWYALQQLFFSGGEELMAQNLEVWSGALSRGILTFSPQRMLDAVRFVTGKDAFYGLMLPSLLYSAILALRPSRKSVHWALVVIAATTWVGWFIVLSVAWPRYAFPPLTFAAICVAQLLHDLTGGFQLPLRELWANVRTGKWNGILAGRAALLALLVLMTGRYLQGRVMEIVVDNDDTPQRMAAHIVEHLPSDAEIETYEPEICFLTGYACHLPDSWVMDASIKHVWYGGPAPSKHYDFLAYGAPYLLIGDFGRWVHLYDEQIVTRDYNLIVTIDGYELYQVKEQP